LSNRGQRKFWKYEEAGVFANGDVLLVVGNVGLASHDFGSIEFMFSFFYLGVPHNIYIYIC
jgi:hypothetical protein